MKALHSSRLAVFLLFFVTLFSALGCRGGSGKSAGELSDLAPHRTEGVRGEARITDGLVPREGGSWNSNRTAVFSSRTSFVEYDLGSERPIDAVAVLADNNDTYQVLGSSDGEKFEPLWTAPRVRDSGVRWRHTKAMGKKARYVRLTPGSGDASLSVAELSVFSSPPAALPPRLEVVAAADVALQLRSALLVFAALLVIACVFITKGRALWFNLALGAGALGGLGYLFWAYSEAIRWRNSRSA